MRTISCGLIAAALFAASPAAADVTDYSVGRVASYTQSSSAQPTIPDVWNFTATLVTGIPDEIVSADVSFDVPPPVSYPLGQAISTIYYFSSTLYSDFNAFNSDFPATTYTLNADRGGGPESGTVELPLDLYPAIPFMTGDTYDRLQSYDASTTFTGTINGFAFTPGTTDGHISIIIAEDNTPGSVLSVSLAPDTTEFEIPANTLLPGRSYSIGIVYLNWVRTENAGFGTATSGAEYFSSTAAYFTTLSPPPPQCVPEWNPGVISARAYHASAFDPTRERVLLFGGFDLGYRDDTWEWDGTAWRLLAITGPESRGFTAMATDTLRGRVVLFGGAGSYDDTWEWDGAAWTQIAPAVSPPARGFHAMAFDSARGVTVLFGGAWTDGTTSFTYGDTWEWDGAAWTEKAVGGPAPAARNVHAMAYDPVRQRTILFGGSEGTNFLNDTWEWDGAAWTLVDSGTGPSGRLFHSLAFDPVTQRVILFGGHPGGASAGDTWAWDGVSWTQLAVPGPAPRYATSLALDAARNQLVLYGGADSTNFADTWEFDGLAWTDRSAGDPGYRVASTMCWDGTRVILFAGSVSATPNGPTSINAQTWGWDGSTWSLLDTGSGPNGGAYASSAFDSARARVVLYGGLGNGPDTWEWDGAAWSLANSSGPTGLDSGLMAYDSARQRIVYHSYRTSNGVAETWEYDGLAWTLANAGGGAPPAHVEAAMCYDAARQVTTLWHDVYGTWNWDGVTWTQAVPPGAGPSAPRFSADMVYDPDRERCILWSGQRGVGLDPPHDTWEWDGAAWTQVAASGPPQFALYGSAWDAANHRVVIYGGYRAGARSNDTWLYVGGVAISAHPTPVTINPGDTATFITGANGLGTITYQWRKDGIDLADGPTGEGSAIIGATTPVLNVSGAQFADEGNYDCIVTSNCGQATSNPAALDITDPPPPCDPDVNCDGAVNGFDVEATEQAVNGDFSNFCQASADLNNDGAENGFDIETEEQRVNGEPC
ncbi:hypothetical protein PHYC_01768 [Phycisphaerales bacterium]|nr:hypothetical protein PHYC_01768 [Phycisphaerales bacterium]